MKLRSCASFFFFGSLVVACAASKKPAAEPASAGSPSPQQPGGYPAGKSDSDSPTTQAEPPPAPPAPQGNQAAPSGGYAQPPPNRGIALAQAGNEMERAQRELDVAAGDCRNACRALGSMDRAAGRLCGLAQSSDEKRRCDDAKNKVYTARDRVKNTCGQCEDVTVDRNAPIPSR